MSHRFKYCALASVYSGTCPSGLQKSLRSVLEQSFQVPIVVVIDGPIGSELQDCLNSFKGLLYQMVPLEKNVGLGPALNAGIEVIKDDFDYLIRFDTDDLNLPQRFKVLVEHIEKYEYDVLGSYITEFWDGLDGNLTSVRKVPLSQGEIAKHLHFRCPFNHPSVAARIDSIIRVGGYPPVRNFEDWALWLKLYVAGCKMGNIDQSLVKFDAGDGMIQRRRGWQHIKKEAVFFNFMGSLKLRSLFIVYLVFFLRAVLRLLPVNALTLAYKVYRRVI